jgi:hypothetical protein
MAIEQESAATWRGDFHAAEERLLEVSLSATPSERLQWLEEALAFAARIGALQKGRSSEDSESRS